MKRRFFYSMVVCCFVITISQAQTIPSIEKQSKDIPERYYFKSFLAGAVYMKNGSKEDAKLNYYIPEQIIAYKNDSGNTMFLAGNDQVDSVVINGFKYVFVENKYYEQLVTYKNGIAILASYSEHIKPSLISDDKQNKGDETSNTLTSVYLRKTFTQSYQIKHGYFFWICKDNKVRKILNLKSISKYFPKKTIL